jgi:hypothetical protein
MIFILIFLLTVITTRIIQVYLFIKQVSKKCDIYDWRCVDENPMLMFEIIEHDYFIRSEWSAYNFLFLKGPSPLHMFLSLKSLTIENIYNETAVAKLNRHEIN